MRRRSKSCVLLPVEKAEAVGGTRRAKHEGGEGASKIIHDVMTGREVEVWP